jgi:hypothetical protein
VCLLLFDRLTPVELDVAGLILVGISAASGVVDRWWPRR